MKGSRGGFGWFQWTGPRRRAFESYCQRNGLDPYSDKANYGFLFVELHGSEKAAVAKTKAAKTLEAKVKAFELAFERAGVKHYASRNTWAKRALDAWNASEWSKHPAPPDFEPPVEKPKPQPPKPVPVTPVEGGGAAAGGAAAGGAAAAAGFDPWLIVLIGVTVAIASFIIIRVIRD